MKKLLCLLLVLCMLMLCACGGKNKAENEPDGKEQQEVEPTPPAVKYRNPLNGTPLDTPYEGRVFAVTIDNVEAALPHHGISQADIFMEMYVNHYATRGLAVFSDIQPIVSVGPIRSTRYNFTDLALAYQMIVIHASASRAVRDDMAASGIDNIFATGWAGYRDEVRYANGHAWEHTLFVKGETAVAAAAEENFPLEISDKDYGLQFTEDGTPAGGSAPLPFPSISRCMGM